MWIANAERSREIDALAQRDFGLTSDELMERAGRHVYETALRSAPCDQPIAVVCGKGANGGDGLVAARLAHAAGKPVRCFVVGFVGELSELCKRRLDEARAAGLDVAFGPIAGLGECSVIVDALLGTGTTGEVREPMGSAIRAINTAGRPVVSVDLPSGLNSDTGEALGDVVRATRTVTFGLPKAGFYQGIGPEVCGLIEVDSIGFPQELLEEPTGFRWAQPARLPTRSIASHKGSHGRLLIVAGSRRMRGAAVLAARAAVRAGCGLVTVASVEPVCVAVAATVPEALLLPLEEDLGAISAVSISEIDPGAYDAAVFGPGLSAGAFEFLRQIWPDWTAPCVLDADALNAVAAGMAPPRGPAVMTPHPGEMRRLMEGQDAPASRFDLARFAAASLGRTVLLKGAHSLVAEVGRPVSVNLTGNPGMAAAGMGDVLSGVIGTLLAQGMAPYEAAELGMHWHGLAGDHCARRIGPVGYGPMDVALALPEARTKLRCSESSYEG